jgi:hypothetical protein
VRSVTHFVGSLGKGLPEIACASRKSLGKWRRPFSRSRRQLIFLLQAASQGRRDLTLSAFDEARIHWAIETGLGPLLLHTTRDDPQAAMSPYGPFLQGADLLARMLTGEQLDAMEEILEACAGRIPPLTLLKGISIRGQYYPEPHLRPMRDIDFLVDETVLPAVASLLYKLGYRQQSLKAPEFYETHHHLMPFVHPQRGVWVEVHRGLFPASTRVGSDRVFGCDHLKTQLRPSAFQGKQVTRLSDELQIVYIASHWAFDFQAIGGMVAMLDLIYLLKNSKEEVRWDQILDWLDGSVASTYLCLMLFYLHTHHLIAVAPEILHGLFTRQRSFGTLNLKIIHTLIDRYIVDGYPLGRVFDSGRLETLWDTLLSPGPPFRNLMRVPWDVFLASRLGIGYARLQSMLSR